jgi:hypothetical protein
LKKLSNQLQPYREVVQVIDEILESPNQIRNKKRIVGHVISFVEFQFGERLPGKSYRERNNGEQISNWTVEIEILCQIYDSLIRIYDDYISLDQMNKDIMILPLHEKRLELLAPWSVDSDDSICIERLNKGQTNAILLMSSVIKNEIAFLFTRRNKFNLAESHCDEALSYARRYDGEEEDKATLLCSAFTAYSDLRKKQFNFVDAATFAEEAYNCVAIAYNPVHPAVQKAAGNLIECLIHKGDFYDAERFAQVTLDSLKDPANGVDQDSEEVAKGYYALGNAIMGNAILNQNGDLTKAERLGRESYRIYVQLYGNDHCLVGISANLLAGTLKLQGKLGDETKELLHRSLALSIRYEGPDGNNTAAGNANLCDLYDSLAARQLTADKRKEHLCLAESYMKEALRISTKNHGSANPQTIDFAARLSTFKKTWRHLMV